MSEVSTPVNFNENISIIFPLTVLSNHIGPIQISAQCLSTLMSESISQKGEGMKKLLLFLLLIATVEASVDSVYTKSNTYAGEIIEITEYRLYLKTDTNLRQMIPVKFINRAILSDSTLIISDKTIQPSFWDLINAQSERQQELDVQLKENDQIELLLNENDLDERFVKAIEDIAQIQKLTFYLYSTMLLISVISIAAL